MSKVFTKSCVSTGKSILAMLNNRMNKFRQDQITLAVDSITFDIQEGERVGIIGHNGAGKTTLLNIISGFTGATSGEVDVHGRINAIMSLGVGIREHLTGIENIYIDGELHGKTKEEIDEKLHEIIDFTDIGEFIHQPVRTYSSGMKARLSFALLSFIEPEILIIDEVLGVGDNSFANKSAKKVRELCEKGKILLVVSHSMNTICELTDRTLLLDHGKLIMDGPSDVVTKHYLELVRHKEEIELQNKFMIRVGNSIGSNDVEIREFYATAAKGKPRSVFSLYDDMSVIVVVDSSKTLSSWDVILTLRKMDGVLLLRQSAFEDKGELPLLYKGGCARLQIDFPRIAFAEGVYELDCEIKSESCVIAKKTSVIKIENVVEFPLSRPDYYCQYEIVQEG